MERDLMSVGRMAESVKEERRYALRNGFFNDAQPRILWDYRRLALCGGALRQESHQERMD
jgi:hypothetical protein